jgi:hypothetical protein
MKQLGNTPSGGAIIELTPSEQLILNNALSALDGASHFRNPFGTHPVKDADVSPLFEIMAMWTELRIDVNRSRQILNDFQASIEGKKEQT